MYRRIYEQVISIVSILNKKINEHVLSLNPFENEYRIKQQTELKVSVEEEELQNHIVKYFYLQKS